MNIRLADRAPVWIISVALTLPGTVCAQNYSRVETVAHHDNTRLWVLGQVQRRAIDSMETSAVTFDPNTALPITTYQFGVLKNSFSYRIDGTLETVTDGFGRTTHYSDWHRGVPRTINYPDGRSQAASVNEFGLIMSVTDENGFTTSYTYDSMGRQKSVSHPSNDDVGWASTTSVFEYVPTAEYGIGAGHWRRTVATGNGVRVTYMDSLWRPLLTREYDAADLAGTQRFTRFGYDDDGRVTFASYPSTSSAPVAGTWTEYDVLGRVTAVSQDSEHGLLITRMEYLPGLKVRVTNPRNEWVTTEYMAFDQPTTEWPVVIEDSAGRKTRIDRDIFGKPRSLARSGSGQ